MVDLRRGLGLIEGFRPGEGMGRPDEGMGRPDEGMGRPVEEEEEVGLISR